MLRAAIEHSPNLAEAYWQLGRSHLQDGRPDLALVDPAADPPVPAPGASEAGLQLATGQLFAGVVERDRHPQPPDPSATLAPSQQLLHFSEIELPFNFRLGDRVTEASIFRSREIEQRASNARTGDAIQDRPICCGERPVAMGSDTHR
mgnify:CR=1 FL=1